MCLTAKGFRERLRYAQVIAVRASDRGKDCDEPARGPTGQRNNRFHGSHRAAHPPPQYPPITELDAQNAKAPPRFEVKAPKGAPNVVVILLDNMGFGDISTFGGPIQMPTLDRLAKTGLRYNNLKVPPLCSPSRVALLTGRNSHSANFGVISEIATGFPGYTAVRPSSVTMLPEILRLNGYNTAMFGKCHELAPWEASVVGPFDRWPVHSGFERFYGFMSGEADLFHPVIYDNMTRLDMHPDADYYASTDITDKAILWLRSQRSLAPEKPFFVYYSAIGTHGPFQVPETLARPLQGQVRSGLGRGAQGNVGQADRAGGRAPGHRSGAQAAGNPGMGRADRRREEGLRPVHGDLRGLCRGDRLRNRAVSR